MVLVLCAKLLLWERMWKLGTLGTNYLKKKNCFLVPSSVESHSFFLPLLIHMETHKLVPNFLNKPEE